LAAFFAELGPIGKVGLTLVTNHRKSFADFKFIASLLINSLTASHAKNKKPHLSVEKWGDLDSSILLPP